MEWHSRLRLDAHFMARLAAHFTTPLLLSGTHICGASLSVFQSPMVHPKLETVNFTQFPLIQAQFWECGLETKFDVTVCEHCSEISETQRNWLVIYAGGPSELIYCHIAGCVVLFVAAAPTILFSSEPFPAKEIELKKNANRVPCNETNQVAGKYFSK